MPDVAAVTTVTFPSSSPMIVLSYGCDWGWCEGPLPYRSSSRPCAKGSDRRNSHTSHIQTSGQLSGPPSAVGSLFPLPPHSCSTPSSNPATGDEPRPTHRETGCACRQNTECEST